MSKLTYLHSCLVQEYECTRGAMFYSFSGIENLVRTQKDAYMSFAAVAVVNN